MKKADIKKLKRPSDVSKPQDGFFRSILEYLKQCEDRVERIERTISNQNSTRFKSQTQAKTKMAAPIVVTVKEPSPPASDDWAPHPDWVDIDNVENGNINLLVSDTAAGIISFICDTSVGQYHVDWGDSSSNDHDSGATAYHEYVYGTGKECVLGYTTFKIVISSEYGSITKLNMMERHNVLWCVYGAIGTTSFYESFASCVGLEAFKAVGTFTNTDIDATSMFYNCHSLQSFESESPIGITIATYMFYGCYGLCKISTAALTNVTDASYMFYECYSLHTVDTSGLVNVANARLMFCYCLRLIEIDLTNMVSITNAEFMLEECYSLQLVSGINMPIAALAQGMFDNCEMLSSIDVSSMVSVTDARAMFAACQSLTSLDISTMRKVTEADNLCEYCLNLKDLVATNFGADAVSTDLSYAFDSCHRLRSINLPNTKVTFIHARNFGSERGSIETLEISQLSPLPSSSVKNIDITNNDTTAEQLNSIFSGLPAKQYASIVVTGCAGAATCDRSIATAKGWTVTG